MQVLLGITLLAVFTVVAETVLGLPTLGWMLSKFWLGSVIVLAIVFQPELRQALAKLGSQRLLMPVFSVGINFVNELISAIKEAQTRRMGMLLVLEQDMGLKDFVETGTVLNAETTRELLLSIFQPPALLHDGAVIIREGKIAAAGCVLPVSNSQDVSKVLGTRHRAAIGLSEITDAWIIVVSEETGKVSVARGGKLTDVTDTDDLRRELIELYRSLSKSPRRFFGSSTNAGNKKDETVTV